MGAWRAERERDMERETHRSAVQFAMANLEVEGRESPNSHLWPRPGPHADITQGSAHAYRGAITLRSKHIDHR